MHGLSFLGVSEEGLALFAQLLRDLSILHFLQGTVIRVFSIPGGQKLYEFRRGMKRSVHSSVGDKYTEGSPSRNVNTGTGQRQILVALASFAERKQEQVSQIEMSLCQTATLCPAASGKFSDSVQCVTEQGDCREQR